MDINERRTIAAADTPGQAKRMGRHVTLRPDWEKVKIDVMRRGLELKFQDYALRVRLIGTGSYELIEGNTWHDNTWGSCVCYKCKNIPGRNLLGNLLMELREQVKSK